MIPSLDKKSCILANRIDIGKHYLTTGGTLAARDSYEIAIGRLQSFGAYIFNPEDYPVITDLFGGENFQATARKTCPASKQVLDPFQFNLIVQVPGQTVATHIDGVYFWGATRFDIPQWLLAAMKFSGLFEDRFVDQIQIVAYYHEWGEEKEGGDEKGGERGGEFVYWNDDFPDPKTVPPTPRSGSGIDGSKVIHAASTYFPDRQPPLTDKNKDVELVYNETNDSWTVFEGGTETEWSYSTSELRSTLVFRARCFESEEKRAMFNDPDQANVDKIELETILEALSKDLVSRGIETSAMSPLSLGVSIIDNYIKYPAPRNVIMPVNYCMGEKLLTDRFGGARVWRFVFRKLIKCQ